MLVAKCSNKTKKIISKRLQETAGGKKKNIFKSFGRHYQMMEEYSYLSLQKMDEQQHAWL